MAKRDINYCAEKFAKYILEMFQKEDEEDRVLRIKNAKDRMIEWCNKNSYSEWATNNLIFALTWLSSTKNQRHIIEIEKETQETSGWLQNMAFTFLVIPDALHAWFNNSIIEENITAFISKLNF
jgi:hypothetical protein